MTSEQQQVLDPHAAVVRAIEDVPGVARVVPGFRQILTSAAKSLLRLDSAERATGVDIVTREGSRRVYVDCHIDGTRPATLVAEDVVAAVAEVLDMSPQDVTLRIMRVEQKDEKG
ncbi:hypothetical protein [Nesterenkonia sp. HG001]|uniref:hypothetical protein n=1 Tax=Nesterenkonia sp. HG001 TaxID=2983207 RepID=UPI002AC4A9C4|nr:hypothetical protein [Nesterenkonia sp. HG001]MDZ5076963.1 hypothetical protein [Nesterenkonia sp. HG001]